MNLTNLLLEESITFSIHIIFLFILMIILIILLKNGLVEYLINIIFNGFKNKDYNISELKLGIGNTSITFKPNYTDREIAYKLWVELSTRKLGLPIDFDEDVIIELYDSWYAFFSVARDLIKEFPISKLNEKNEKDLVEITIELLNNVLRAHLTTWQAKFRKWYNQELEKEANKNLTPQEIQSKYKYYDKLTVDLNEINEKLDYYKKILYSISHDKELTE